jgi:hypothetical protein
LTRAAVSCAAIRAVALLFLGGHFEAIVLRADDLRTSFSLSDAYPSLLRRLLLPEAAGVAVWVLLFALAGRLATRTPSLARTANRFVGTLALVSGVVTITRNVAIGTPVDEYESRAFVFAGSRPYDAAVAYVVVGVAILLLSRKHLVWLIRTFGPIRSSAA